MAGGKKIWKFLLRILGTLVSVLLLALITFSLILANPQKKEEKPPAATPSPYASPAITVESETDLTRLISEFPAPVMNFMSGSGMVFVSATSADAAFEGGFGRIATLYWQTPEGEPVTLQSIWPANALSLMDPGFHFETGSATLFGNTAVKMKNTGSVVRYYTTTEKGLYAVLMPESLDERVSDICRSLQLFTVNPAD